MLVRIFSTTDSNASCVYSCFSNNFILKKMLWNKAAGRKCEYTDHRNRKKLKTLM